MTGTADIVVVGAGAAGLAFAFAAAAPGLRVVVLEAGGPVDQRRAPNQRTEWELALQTSFNNNPNVRQAPADYPVDDSESDIAPAIFSAVGGSTIRWGAHFPRFRPSDFRRGTMEGVGDDWPLSYDDLVPFYDLNDAMMGVSGLAGDPGNPPRAPRPAPPLPLCDGTTRLAQAFDRLGWHWWPSDAAILSRGREDRAA
ncbi:NAD(P)-binding protein, partial [Salipiger mucosus]|uniref:NAD(P)-binding protein n=1 Tax=Salipiger mucosus TaxID=263378 RepID=UPI0012EBFBEC